MSKVAVVTDTISCIPANLIKEYDIRIIPIGLVIDRKEYKDTDLTNEQFWDLFYKTKEPITTNAANPADFESIFSDLARTTDSIVCIPVSRLLSATCNMADQAKTVVQARIPSLKIEIIDSKSATGAQGFIVLEAARAAAAGQSLAEVTRIAQELVPRIKFFSSLSTLKYLRRCGRAPKSAFLGDWLQVKPILGMINGSGLVENLGRERGMDKAIEKMLDLAAGIIDPSRPLHVMAHYSDDITIGEKIRDFMTSRYQCSEAYLTPYTAVMSSQTGPVVAVAFYQ